MIFQNCYSKDLVDKTKQKRIEKVTFPYGKKIYRQSSSLRMKKDFYRKIGNNSKLYFSPLTSPPLSPTVIAFQRVKKSPLIIRKVDRIKVNFCKQLFPFSESELSHTFCKMHISTYFTCTSVSFIFATIAQVWANLHRQHVFHTMMLWKGTQVPRPLPTTQDPRPLVTLVEWDRDT